DRRTVPGPAETPADLEAVEAGHEHVEHDRVDRSLPEPLQGVDAVDRSGDAVPLELERSLDRLADVRLVVDHEDAPADRRADGREVERHRRVEGYAGSRGWRLRVS